MTVSTPDPDLLPGPVVSAQWLRRHASEVRIVDVRWSLTDGPKRTEFDAGRIPGAVFADLDADLSARAGERGRHPLPSPEHFADLRARLDLVTRPVVAYDDQSGAVAARLWWMLDAIGHPAAVLDGGMAAWAEPLESGPVDRAPTAGSTSGTLVAEPVPWPAERFVGVDDVLPAVAAGALLLDARSADRFAGRPNPIDDRPGHVPGAASRPWTDNIGDDGRFLPPQRLREALAGVGAEPGRPLLASCGSGVTACHDLLAARLAGIDGGRLYTGSWSEWSLDPDRPVAITGEPGTDTAGRLDGSG